MTHRFLGAGDPATDVGYPDPPARKGFFTDTSVCIGCKACEVACKEWNAVPADNTVGMSGDSYDNTGGLGASTWRHVAFIEQPAPLPSPPPAEHSGLDVLALAGSPDGGSVATGCDAPSGSSVGGPAGSSVTLGMPTMTLPGADTPVEQRVPFRWLMESDVCKHCTRAACLDVCPTGALFRTEFGTVVVQADICNGCGYCVPACPYGVIERRDGPPGDAAVGVAQKCTLCYDRLKGGLEPACAKACPTQSIQFGDLDELRDRARDRLGTLVEAGVPGAQLYGHDPDDGVGGTGAFFLLLDRPEVYGLPPDPVVTTQDLPRMWRRAGLAALTLLGGAVATFAGRRSA
jgi:formate dehydrogenase iron-sulfur subunit